MSYDEKIDYLRDYPSILRETVTGLSEEQLTTNYVEGEWTIAQNVHHLFDAHANSFILCRRVLTEDNFGMSWPNQDLVTDLPDAKDANIKTSLMALEGLHKRWANMFDNVTDWDKSGTSLQSGRVWSMADLLEEYTNHCKNHLQQIQDVKDAIR